MLIERTFALATPREQAWRLITAPEEVGACLPGCQKVDIVSPGKYKAVIAIKVGPIKSIFNIEVETQEERPPEFAAYIMRGEEGDRASRVSAECTLALKDIPGGRTEVTYTSRVNVVGRLGKFAGGVMKKFIDSTNDQFIEALSKRIVLEGGQAVAPIGEAKQPGGLGRVWRFFRRFLNVIRRLLGSRMNDATDTGETNR